MCLKWCLTQLGVLSCSTRLFYCLVAMGGYHEMLPRMQTGTLSPCRPAWPDGLRRRLRKLWSYLLILEWTCPCWQRTQPGAGSPGPSQSPAVLLRGWPPEHDDNKPNSVSTIADIHYGLRLISSEKITTWLDLFVRLFKSRYLTSWKLKHMPDITWIWWYI